MKRSKATAQATAGVKAGKTNKCIVNFNENALEEQELGVKFKCHSGRAIHAQYHVQQRQDHWEIQRWISKPEKGEDPDDQNFKLGFSLK